MQLRVHVLRQLDSLVGIDLVINTFNIQFTFTHYSRLRTSSPTHDMPREKTCKNENKKNSFIELLPETSDERKYLQLLKRNKRKTTELTGKPKNVMTF